METKLLDIEVQEFIKDSLNKNISVLALQKNPFPEIPWSEILTQIQSKQKAKEKLPTWYNTDNILFPKSLSIEQTSSEKCAAYKAELVSGENLIDLTGGFGIDTYYFSKRFKNIVHCELQEELSSIVAHNYKLLNTSNIECICGDSLEILRTLNRKWDYIYIDPARRNKSKEKVFFLKDCEPNVPELIDEYIKYTSSIIIKTAPLLDITAGLSELKFVKEIHIVAIDNEVKELLWILEKNYRDTIKLIAANIKNTNTEIFETTVEATAVAQYSLPKTYLYEPNSAVMKTGKFDVISEKFGLDKLHKHSQLYTSDSLIDFPGRVFKIADSFVFNKQNTNEKLKNKKANITTRNFPMSVIEIRKKWKIKEGGDQYYFFTTIINDEKIVLKCYKVS